jgi:hypothetical protein
MERRRLAAVVGRYTLFSADAAAPGRPQLQGIANKRMAQQRRISADSLQM